jgi:hypothetical protein
MVNYLMNNVTSQSSKADIIAAGTECVDYYIHLSNELRRQRAALLVVILCFAIIFIR